MLLHAKFLKDANYTAMKNDWSFYITTSHKITVSYRR
jgi:hypothetical protein